MMVLFASIWNGGDSDISAGCRDLNLISEKNFDIVFTQDCFSLFSACPCMHLKNSAHTYSHCQMIHQYLGHSSDNNSVNVLSRREQKTVGFE